MGADIHCYAERRKMDGTWEHIPDIDCLSHRSYGKFGFLANVRHYSAVPPLALPRGLPSDVSLSLANQYEDLEGYAHTPSWLSLSELMSFNYDALFENRRVMINNNGGCTCEPGTGEMITYRAFLGEGFQDELRQLQAIGAERIVFWFDN
jgi:hypothetical protein